MCPSINTYKFKKNKKTKPCASLTWAGFLSAKRNPEAKCENIDSFFFFLQWRHIMLIFRFIIVFRITIRIGLHALMLKNRISCLKLSAAAAPVCLLKAPPPSALIGRQCALCCQSALSNFQLPLSITLSVNLGMNNTNTWHCDVAWCHKVTELKAGLLTRCFRNSDFCGREELPLAFWL